LILAVVKKILLVCVGNICRSPVAQYRLQLMLPGCELRSAGLAALVGHDMDATARSVALEHGLECPPHRARQLTPELCRWADLILVMERRHLDALGRIPPQSRGKVFLLGDGLGEGGVDIYDPYERPREVFEFVYSLITRATEDWAHRLGA
jgi:protein-tyrosine phosphatase